MRSNNTLLYTLGALGLGAIGLAAASGGKASANAANNSGPAPKPSGKYTPEQAAKALRLYLTQGTAVDWGSKAKPNSIIKLAQADMLQLTADGAYGPATKARGEALTGSAWPDRPKATIPSNRVAVTSSKARTPATPAADARAPATSSKRTPATQAADARAATVIRQLTTPAAPEPNAPPGSATARTAKQAAQDLYNHVTAALRAGNTAELGDRTRPNDRIAAAQRDMRLVTSDGIYGPKTAARGKELLGLEFPSRTRTQRALPAADVLNKAPPAPPLTASNEQVRAAEGLLSYLSKPGADQGAKGRPSTVVRAAQSAMGGVTADGVYGPATRARGAQLTGETFPPRK